MANNKIRKKKQYKQLIIVVPSDGENAKIVKILSNKPISDDLEIVKDYVNKSGDYFCRDDDNLYFFDDVIITFETEQ